MLIMKKLLLALVGILFMTGCVHSNYSLIVYNGTSGQIDRTAVFLENGRSFRFGILDPDVDAGIYPVKGPFGDAVTVKWVNAGGGENAAEAPLSCGFMDDSIIFLIHADHTVTVQTGRDL
jgi:hypothetical protein